jgi:hypothetical protein
MKVILLLECDDCLTLLGASASGQQMEDQSWMTTAENLLAHARNNGWHLRRQGYTCHDCHVNGQENQLN